jgi:homoserine kinase
VPSSKLSASRLLGARIAVPGSTSNIGAGFDALGLAVRLYLRLRVLDVAEDGREHLRFHFVGPSPSGDNAIERSLRHAAATTGVVLPSMEIEVTSEIPVRAGLGSSAAALVAGLRLFQLIDDTLGTDMLLDAAAALEGHPDNTSAAILGGFTVSCSGNGHVIAAATAWPERIRLAVATPNVSLSTQTARAALPVTVPLDDAVYNIQRASLLVQALATDRPTDELMALLRESVRDRLHQPHRTALVPGLAEALRFEHPSLAGVFLSGAGPSIAAFVVGDMTTVESMFRSLYERLRLGCTVRTLAVHQPDVAGKTRTEAYGQDRTSVRT